MTLKKNKYKNFLAGYERFNRPLILGGAMGSLLQQKGLPQHKYLWNSKNNLDYPDIVRSLHKEYISNGADIITTNTFRTNPYAIKQSGLDINEAEFVKKSVELAINSKNDFELFIAGSNAPAEDCYQKERTITIKEMEYNHKTHIEYLWNSGVDIIWNETQSHWDEIKIICEYCSKNKIPYAMNLFFTDKLEILSGEKLNAIVCSIEKYKPDIIGFNCIKYNTLHSYINANSLPKNWGFYLNCGSGNLDDDLIKCGVNSTEYLEFVKDLLNYNPIFVGSCCGSSPKHTRAIKDFFDEFYRN